ncbi:MAG: hypothetical protein IJV72_01300 [Clostridia bacterium]|nr:hypothetical protein [Clostridia bacterium]
MNNTFDTQTNFDSLGRRVGIANGFSAYTPQMLEYMRNDLKLAMSLSTLSLCSRYYKNTKQNKILLSELYLLDAIIRGTSSLPCAKTVTEVLASDSEIISSYNDLITKHHYTCGEIKHPLSLDSLSKVNSEYMRKIGVSFTEKNQRALSLFELDNTDKLIDSRDISAPMLPPETAFLILTPTHALSPYASLFKCFAKTDAFDRLVIRSKKIDSRGIAFALSQMANGILGDLYSIPELVYPSELSALATEHHGKVIIALRKENIPAITAVARECGLETAYFAKSVGNNKFTLLNNKNISMSLDTALIRLMGESLFGTTFNITDKVSEVFTSRSHIMLKGARGAQRLAYGDIVAFSGTLYSPLHTELGENRYSTAMSAVLDSLLPLIACGVNLSDVSLNIKYTFSSEESTNESSNELSAILGVYRALVELCIADSPETEYLEDSVNSLSLVAQAKLPVKVAPSHFKKAGDAVYLFSFNKAENGMPDFDSFRKMCGFINELVVSGRAVSVRAVSGKVIDTIDTMRGGFEFVGEASVANLLEEYYQGFIVETDIPQVSGILLGAVTQKSEEIPVKTEETV